MKQSGFNIPLAGIRVAKRMHDNHNERQMRATAPADETPNGKGYGQFLSMLALLFAVFFAVSCGNSGQTSEEVLQKEKDAILATIEQETEAFFARDYDSWKANYVQEDYAFQAWSNRDGTFDSSVGWENIDNSVGRYIHDNPEPVSSHPIVERKNIKFKFYGDDVAYLTWDQFNSDRENQLFFHSKEVRLMEKVGNEWKIVCVSAFWDFKNLIPVDKLSEIQRMDKESRGKDKI